MRGSEHSLHTTSACRFGRARKSNQADPRLVHYMLAWRLRICFHTFALTINALGRTQHHRILPVPRPISRYSPLQYIRPTTFRRPAYRTMRIYILALQFRHIPLYFLQFLGWRRNTIRHRSLQQYQRHSLHIQNKRRMRRRVDG